MHAGTAGLKLHISQVNKIVMILMGQFFYKVDSVKLYRLLASEYSASDSESRYQEIIIGSSEVKKISTLYVHCSE